MLVIDININRTKEIASIGAVRIFPAYPYEPRKNKLCLYQCGEVVDGKLNPDTIYYIWFKYGCGLDLSLKILKAYNYTKKYGFIWQYSGPEQKRNRDSYDPLIDEYNFAGKRHRIDGSLRMSNNQEYWSIADEHFFSEEAFRKELKKYEIKTDIDALYLSVANISNNNKHKGC